MVFLILNKKMTRCMILFTMEMGFDDSKINVYARQIVINYLLLIYIFKNKNENAVSNAHIKVCNNKVLHI